MSAVKCDKRSDCLGMTFIKEMKGQIDTGFSGIEMQTITVYSVPGKSRAKKTNFIFNYCPSCGADIAPKKKKGST